MGEVLVKCSFDGWRLGERMTIVFTSLELLHVGYLLSMVIC